MCHEQEYIKFWCNVINKCDEIQKDYLNLSDINQYRVDNVRDTIFRAHTVVEVLNILNDQVKKQTN
jgi:hypothetical protein